MRSPEAKRWKDVARAFGIRRGAPAVELLPPTQLTTCDAALRQWFGLELASDSPGLDLWLSQLLMIPLDKPSPLAEVESESPPITPLETIEVAPDSLPEVTVLVTDSDQSTEALSSEDEGLLLETPSAPIKSASHYDPNCKSGQFFRSLPFGGQARHSQSPTKSTFFDFTPSAIFFQDVPWSGQPQTQIGLPEMMALATQDALARSRRPSSLQATTLPNLSVRQFLSHITWQKGALSA